jgi:hypothetical protein
MKVYFTMYFYTPNIVIKPGPGVDPAKGPSPGSTRVNPEKLKKN